MPPTKQDFPAPSPTVAPRLRRALGMLRVLPLVVRSARRVSSLERTRDVRELSERLRGGELLAARDRDPQLLAAATDRLCPVLPPWGMGRCLKRSLILLDLWSRCGLHPALHLGIRPRKGGRWEGHAWLSTESLGATAGPYVELTVL